jgi:hypothetical protein
VLCDKFKDGPTTLNDDAEKHRDRPRTSHTDENCITVQGSIRKDRRVKVRENALQQTAVQYLIFLGDAHYREGMLKHGQRWRKYLNANGDYCKINVSIWHFSVLLKIYVICLCNLVLHLPFRTAFVLKVQGALSMSYTVTGTV